jgi:integrase
MGEHITEKLLKKLRPPLRGSRIVYDRELRGFGVRITAAGAVAFILNYHVHGRERRFTIGRRPEMTAEMARTEALRLRELLRQGHDPLAEKERARGIPSVTDLAEDYLRRHAEPFKRPLSIRDDRRLLQALILPRLGRLQVSGVTRADVEKLHREFASTPVQANRVLALLSKMFNLAVQWGWVRDNPVRGVQKFHESPRQRYLRDDELPGFFRALAASETDPDLRDYLLVRLLTGVRQRNIFEMRWADLDLDHGRWRIGETKNKDPLLVPLSAPIVRMLAGRPRAGEWVFPGHNSGTHVTTMNRAWRTFRRRAGVPDLQLRDLRRTLATHALAGGASMAVIAKGLGHRSTTVTAGVYALVGETAVRRAFEETGQRLLAAGNERNADGEAKEAAGRKPEA